MILIFVIIYAYLANYLDWLDAKYNTIKQQYVWNESEGLEFTLFLYRAPR